MTLLFVFILNIHGSAGKEGGGKEETLLRPPPGVTKRCRLSWLTKSAIEYEPRCGGRGKGCKDSANEYSCAHEAQINFVDLTLYLTHGPQLPLLLQASGQIFKDDVNGLSQIFSS